MADNDIVRDGFIVIILSVLLFVPPIFNLVDNLTGIGSENLSYIVIIAFFGGIGITIIGFTSKPRQ